MELNNENWTTEQQSVTSQCNYKSEESQEETAFVTPAACGVFIDNDYQALSQNTIDPDTQYATPYIRH